MFGSCHVGSWLHGMMQFDAIPLVSCVPMVFVYRLFVFVYYYNCRLRLLGMSVTSTAHVRFGPGFRE